MHRRPTVFSIGYRNPQGLDWEPGSDRLVITGQRPSGFDGPARAPRPQRLFGWLGNCLLAVAIVLLYATFFAAVAHNDHLAAWDVFAGAVHAVLGGVVAGAWSDLHPQMPHEVPAGGALYRHYGRCDVRAFVAGHLFSGTLAGTLYAVLHQGLAPAAAL